MNIFQEVTLLYGEELAREAMEVINWYVDVYYPHVTKHPHEFMSKAKRMVFAKKLLDCFSELSVDLEMLTWVLMNIADTCAQNGTCDPNIYYATTPTVIGYWLLYHPEYDVNDLRSTKYCPVDTIF